MRQVDEAAAAFMVLPFLVLMIIPAPFKIDIGGGEV
jgi:hypothetical protein